MHKYATVFCTSSVSVLEVNVNRDLCLSVVGSGCGCGGGEVGGGGERLQTGVTVKTAPLKLGQIIKGFNPPLIIGVESLQPGD